MLTNGFFKSKDRFKVVQKAIMAGIGATTSKEVIKKAAIGLYDDIQKVVHKLLIELEERGEVKAKETKKILNELQKKSEVEKTKIYKKLKKDSKGLLNTAKNIILTPIVIANQVAGGLKKPLKTKNKKAGKRFVRKLKKRK